MLDASEPPGLIGGRPMADVTGSVNGGRDTFERSTQAGSGPRPWLGVRFTCSGAYLRVYRSNDGATYLARCPGCGKSVRFRVGSGGTSERFFVVRC